MASDGVDNTQTESRRDETKDLSTRKSSSSDKEKENGRDNGDTLLRKSEHRTSSSRRDSKGDENDNDIMRHSRRETEEERAERKRREKERDNDMSHSRRETEEERAERKRREKERDNDMSHSRRETEEERAERKRREKERDNGDNDMRHSRRETEEERTERKRQERERDKEYRDRDLLLASSNGGGGVVDSKDPYGMGGKSRDSLRPHSSRAQSSRHLSSGSSSHHHHRDSYRGSRSQSVRHLDDKRKSSEHYRRSSSRKETEEERAERKRREAERDKETEEERAERKKREAERYKETEEERAERKKREAERDKETEEERAERKKREAAERANETEEERAERKRREAERDKERRSSDRDRDRDRDKDRRSSDKDRRSSDRDRDRRSSRHHHRSSHNKESEEERAERKKREKEEDDKRAERKKREKEEEEKLKQERDEQRLKEREERMKRDEEAKLERDKERDALREERRKEKEAKYGKRTSTLQVNRGDLRAKSTEKFNNVYSLGTLIYESDDCKVHICQHRATGTERAVKITPKKLSSCHEFDMLKQADHPNVLTMYDLFDEEGPNGFEFYLVVDLCKGGTVHRLLMKKLGKEIPEATAENNDPFGLGGLMSALTGQEEEEEEDEYEADGYGLEEAIVRKIMMQLLSCVNYLHKNRLVHADLKPQNILLPNKNDFDTIKVIDFDNSILLRKADDKVSSKKGTPEYMAPEVHAGQKYDYKADIWSCGVIAYQLLSNSLPFGDSEEIDEEDIRKRVEEGSFKLGGPKWGSVSQEAKDFVKSLLVVREKKRPTAEKCLVHPWIGPSNDGVGKDGEPAAPVALNKDASAMAAMSNFRKFNADTKLKKATCSFIASQLLTKEEKDKIDSIFRAMDITKDGKLSKTEVKAGFFQVFGTFMTDTEIDEIFARVDCDGTGEIEYSEFVIASMAETDLLSQDRLRKAFQLFDKDNSGSITISELREIFSFFQTAGADMDDEYIDSVIKAVDSDGNGDVSFDEFVEMMTTGVH